MTVDRQLIVEAVADAYCTQENKHKVVDQVLCTTIIDNVMAALEVDEIVDTWDDDDEYEDKDYGDSV